MRTCQYCGYDFDSGSTETLFTQWCDECEEEYGSMVEHGDDEEVI
jgi:hypothetical protein